MLKLKTRKKLTLEGKIAAKLNSIQELLENLFILEAIDSNMPVEEVRKVLKIDKKRINAISKKCSKDCPY